MRLSSFRQGAVGHCACRKPEDVPDAIQDALLAVTEKMTEYRGEGSIKSWVSTMVVNACRCHGRGRKNDPLWNLPMDAASELPDHSQSPNESLARRELLVSPDIDPGLQLAFALAVPKPHDLLHGVTPGTVAKVRHSQRKR